MKLKILALTLLAAGSLAAYGQDEGWRLTATSTENYTGVPVASGRIGILPWKEPFSVRHVILNHVFDRASEFGIQRVLKGINPFGLSMSADSEAVTADNTTGWSQCLDMRTAAHATQFEIPGKARVSYTVYALRNMPFAGLVRVSITALGDTEIEVSNTPQVPDGYRDVRRNFSSLRDGGTVTDVTTVAASSRFGAQTVAASYSFMHEGRQLSFSRADSLSRVSMRAGLKAGETVEFALVGSICSTRDFATPAAEAERQVVYASKEGCDRLIKAHCRLWDELWQADVIIEGDAAAQQAVRLALFSLYGSGHEGSRLSMSPMGLSMQGYNGHVFWDSELWMYPPLLLLNEPEARAMIDYRTDRLPSARRRAMAHGYRGAMFPWESDDAGDEATPQWALSGPQEHHITADIAIAAWNYYCVTRDLRWLRSEGYPLISQCAEFWLSRVEPNDDGTFSIRNVVGADEYAQGVDDNAMTNGAARRALLCAHKAARACGLKPDKRWKQTAMRIRILQFEDGTTREYEGYDGRMVKQADANLLGYPLGIVTGRERLLRDLEYYAGRIDPNDGPAMSYAVLCVQYARLGMADEAERMLRLCYQPNLRPPFGVMAETARSSNPYFATGAGGLLQAVINGFGGLEITDRGIRQLKTVLPPSWKRLTIKGVGPQRKTYTVENKK